jgi:hypothetical protein
MIELKNKLGIFIMSVNPVDIFQGCFDQIQSISTPSASSEVIQNIKVSLTSLFFCNGSEIDCVRDDIGALRDRLDHLDKEGISRRVSTIWQKWFEAKACVDISLQLPHVALSSAALVSFSEKDSLETRKLKKLLDKWQECLDDSFENLEISSFDNSMAELLCDWMNKISKGRDFNNPFSQKKIARLVISIIEFATMDEEFCQLCQTVIENSTGRCQDGGMLGLNILSLEKRVRQSGAITLESLLKLLKSVYAASLLEEAAIKIVFDNSLSSKQQSSMDPVEVFLALQMVFKDTFELPFESESMDFFDMALLNDDKIKEIKKAVRKNLNNQESLAQFLLEQYSWKLRLETVYANEISSIQETLFQKLDALDEKKEQLPNVLFIEQSMLLKEEYNDVMKVWLKSKTEEIIDGFKPTIGKKRNIQECDEV